MMTVFVQKMSGHYDAPASGFSIEEREVFRLGDKADMLRYSGRVIMDPPEGEEPLCGPMYNGTDIKINGKLYMVLDRFESQAACDLLSR